MERRLAAIVAIDVVGYSRLMNEDEEGTHRAVKDTVKSLINPKVAQYRGRIVKLTGDGALFEFASAVDAVTFAVEMQCAMRERNCDVPKERRIDYRVGINIGDIFIEPEDIYGDGVNIAARLEALADPGGICVARNVFNQVKGKFDLTFKPLGERKVKNIPQSVSVYGLVLDDKAHGLVTAVQPAASRRRPRTYALAGGIALLLLAVFVAWWQPWKAVMQPAARDRMASLSDKPSIAVLPFSNLSGDPTQDYFSDGLTEDIINALGRYRDLAVMAYNASLPFRSTTTNPHEIRRALGVRYLVKGTVRRTGEKVRISTRLTDAQKGTLLWSERFDNENKDILAIQDAIAHRVAGTLISNLTRVEQVRALSISTTNMGAYDLVLRGRAELRRATRSANRHARQSFERATELDSDYAAAYAWLGRAHYQQATDGWTEFPAQSLKLAESFAQKALTLDPRSVDAIRTLARIHAIQFQLERALAEIDQAISINPSHAEALGDRGVILLWSGQPEKAIAAFEPAFVFDPNLRGDYVFSYGLSYYSLHRHKEAIKILENGASLYPNYVFVRIVLVAAYSQLGNVAEAQRNAEEVKRLLPIFDPKRFGARFQNPTLRKYLTKGLTKDGFF